MRGNAVNRNERCLAPSLRRHYPDQVQRVLSQLTGFGHVGTPGNAEVLRKTKDKNISIDL